MTANKWQPPYKGKQTVQNAAKFGLIQVSTYNGNSWIISDCRPEQVPAIKARDLKRALNPMESAK